jgi:hypothetical protein
MNAFQYAYTTEENWKMNLGDMTDFRPSYTFYSDFGIAEFCEVYMRDANAVAKTYNRVEKYWGGDIKTITEVALVLNHKLWSFYEGVESHYLNCGEEWKEHFISIYNTLYERCVKFIQKTYGNDAEAMAYYYKVTD